MIVAGIGCRKGASRADVLAAIAAAVEAAAIDPGSVDLIATAAEKGGEDGIAEAAAVLGRPLVLIPSDRLQAAGSRAVTHSDRVVALFAVPSVAEASALAAAGVDSALIVPRRVAGAATCALAEQKGPF
ncbi:cobalamin biosynthesis protein [Kaistia dalseonensis]|uniref:Cobalt-precorrin 5A hydrolase n=1 Tax=Kaistia dalseonensis TaxID=410840 RepID=A0ABU0HAE2_9HYPH|nr:cobalamin biosynthesis protein [Kaistia dalseonensis]MCX5496654.1 cobalamin biosynthesis protein [Kaistia dalseonensis]MDQ0439277.1 cobalt-precorrin 5A hydrolase [Kaistia dalseonensis]